MIFTGYYSKSIIMISLSLLDILWYLKYVNNVKTFWKDFNSYRNTPQDVIKIISQIKFAIVIFHGVELITWLLKIFHLTLLNLRAISHLKHCFNLKTDQQIFQSLSEKHLFKNGDHYFNTFYELAINWSH